MAERKTSTGGTRRRAAPAVDERAEDRGAAETSPGPAGKQEITEREEHTMPGRFYAPETDIYETDESLLVVMDVPGVNREQISVTVEKGILAVEAQVDFSNYRELAPVYSEYNVGHFARRFRLGDGVDGDRIDARVENGVLTVEIAKRTESRSRRIEVH